jgi:peptidyl-prolyl cis-trans isomerase D
MLQFIREKTSGVIALVIVALLIVTFAFWGVSYYFDQGGDVVAVSVNDADIELFEYQRIYQNVRKRWQQILKDDVGSINDDLVKEQTLDSLIEQELINQLSDDLNLRVSAEQVRDLIGGIQVFQGVNGFDNNMYERSVAQLGYTTLMFEQQIQEDIKADQIQSSLSESAFVTDGEVKLLAGLTNQSRDVSYSIISSNELKESLQISEEAIAEFYDQNSRDYLEPEQVKIAYVEMSLKSMAAGLEVSEEDIRGYYETNKADYDVDDQRKIRHLTIRTGENATPERLEEVTGKAEELLRLLKSGISFQQLSEKHNNDIDFDIEISDLGFLTKGIMSAEIDELMFSLEEGAISEPIMGKESVDLIKVEKIKGGKKNTFENVRELIWPMNIQIH